MSSTSPIDFTFHQDGEETDAPEQHTASILDLIETKDEFISLSGSADVDEIIQGDSLDEILKTPTSDDKGRWRTSKIAEEYEKKKRSSRFFKRKLKIIVLISVVVLLTGFVVIYFLTPEKSISALTPINKVSLEQLRISPTLKDEGQLSGYHKIALKLFASGKTKEAQTVFRKLADTGWNGAVIQKNLGECREKLGDKSGALKYYKQAVSLGYRDDPHPVVLVAADYYKKKQYSKVILTLRIPRKLFPGNEAISALLGSAYYQSGNRSKAIEYFDKTNPNRLSEDQMRDYAFILERKGDVKKAFRLYLTLAKAYGDEDAFVKAEKLAPDQKTRVYLLSTLVAKFKNTSKGAAYTVKLAERRFFNDERKSALRLLEGIDSNLLDKEGAEKFIGMIFEFRDSPILLNECHKILNKHFANDCDFQIRLMDVLKRNGGLAFCREFFKQQYAMYSKNTVTNYMYSLFQSSNARRIVLLKRSLSLNPSFFQASMALGEIYMTKQEWGEAKKQFLKCLKISPNSLESHWFLTVCELKLEDSPAPLRRYEAFLLKTGIKEADRLKEMISLSQYMKSPDQTLAYLTQAERFPKLSRYIAEERIKTKFIYSAIEKNDFPSPLPSYLKFYYQMFLISKGHFRRMMLIPTRREDFPEFWKVFICWRTGIKSWRTGAELILKRDETNVLISTIVKLWLKRISPSNAALLIDSLPYQEKPLMTIMIAEEYYRMGDVFKSELFYKQALHYSSPNIYVQLADFLRKNK
ncbi:MAG: tetratricopeptide repeat protein [Kiritimatiellaeota bacterium]|nr:tetratricopeptide repeat protein [Kiritimatiellota bacterium]